MASAARTLAERLRSWRMDHQLSETHAAAKIRKGTRLQLTVERLKQLEVGHPPDPEELLFLNKFLP